MNHTEHTEQVMACCPLGPFVELKSVVRLDVHVAQIISYPQTTRLCAGLLINLRVPLLHERVKRIV